MTRETPKSNSAQGSPFNRKAQHSAKRAAILSQAAKLFNSKGSRTTTLQDIAASLGLTKTSLYYYVKTKEELIYQCYLAALQRHHSTLDHIEQQHSAPLERASAFFLQHFDNWLTAQEGRGPHTAALLEIASLKGEHREEIEQQYIALFKRLRGYLREGLENGELTPCDPTSATRAILGSVEWTFSWLHQIPREQVSEVAQQALDIFAHGLFAGKARYQPIALPDTEHEDETQLAGFNRDEQNRQKQQAFYKTGTWFFNKQGFAGTSLDEIAEHLNVSKGAFYYHIKNKEDLLYSCYDYSLDIMENIHRQTDGIDYSGLQKVDHVCRRTFQVQNSEQGPLIRYNTITSLPIARRKRILQRTEASNERFGEFLRQGIADGSVRDINVFVAENLIAGAINAAMDIDLWRAVDDIDSAAKDYFDLFYNGLLPRNG